jgi:chemosensory pili system protein ChpA (sensor histidine kinase/response regulator)
VRLGDQEYPRVVLGEALGLSGDAEAAVPKPPVLLLNAGGSLVALVVDQLLGGREIVVKNLGSHVRRLHGIAGATLLGDGSVVLILNPADLAPERLRGRAAPRPAPVAAPARPLTVLVVDDSPSVRRVTERLIRGAGWVALTARDGLEALELLQGGAALPDVLLVDVEMPRMDGYELVSTMKAHSTLNHLPAVMVTSRAGVKHRRKAEESGAAGYLVKPYQDNELLALVRRLAVAGAG